MPAVDGEPAAAPVLTLSGKRLPLPGRARVYACGITPYDVTHLGHAATFVWVDTLARILRSAGTEVILCRNVTDVDDVLLAAANRAGSPYDRYAAIQQFYFDRDMAALGVTEPALQPRAHAFIGQVIALTSGLLALGAAYERDGTVYFAGADAARQSGLDRDTALRLAAEYGDRPDDPAKDDPFDVILWHAADQGEAGVETVAWPSPWGPGRPGWHAECAAMALHAFGPAIDVHAGGGDLRFPHHAYQAALAERLHRRRAVCPRQAQRRRRHDRRRQDGQVDRQPRPGQRPAGASLRRRREAADPEPCLARGLGLRASGLDAAARRLEMLQIAAGQPENSAAAVAAVRGALADDLNVPVALAIAEEAGGQAARVLGSLLGLW